MYLTDCKDNNIYIILKLHPNDVGSEIYNKDNVLLQRHGKREKEYSSIFGEHKIVRTRYWKKESKSIFPLDIQCNLPEKKFSYFLQKFMEAVSISNPFDQAGKRIEQFLGKKLYTSSLESVNEDSSRHYEQFYKQKEIPDADSEGELQVASFDGKGVPMIKKEAAKIKGRQGKGEKRQKKKEALVGVSYSVDKKKRTAEEVAKNLIYPERKQEKIEDTKKVSANNIRRLASLEKPKSEVIKEIEVDCINRNITGKKTLVLIDGSLYLWKLVTTHFTKSKDCTVILDIIHVLEYIYLAAHSLHKEKTKESKKYAYNILLRLLKGQVRMVIGGLKRGLKRKGLSKSKKEALEKVITYFTNHQEIMQYDTYLTLGYPIGTGIVESTCKLLVNDRMEGSGMRWSIKGAEAMLKMRSIEKSNDMEEYNCFYRQQENKRIYTTKYYRNMNAA